MTEPGAGLAFLRAPVVLRQTPNPARLTDDELHGDRKLRRPPSHGARSLLRLTTIFLNLKTGARGATEQLRQADIIVRREAD